MPDEAPITVHESDVEPYLQDGYEVVGRHDHVGYRTFDLRSPEGGDDQ